MGNESTCTARFGKKKLTGQALLETSELLFRPTGGRQRDRLTSRTACQTQGPSWRYRGDGVQHRTRLPKAEPILRGLVRPWIGKKCRAIHS